MFLFPFLIAGLAAITTVQAKNWIEGEPLYLLYGPGFMIGTMVAMAAYLTVYYRRSSTGGKCGSTRATCSRPR